MNLPIWTVLPFAGLLACIAVLPIVAGHWWHANRNKAIVGGLLSLPIAGYLLGAGVGTQHELFHALEDYGSFLVMLTALYVISGGIALRGSLPGKPSTNVAILAIGAVLANLIGTTGASMVLIRPFLRANRNRKSLQHLPVFFIFVVSNTGGLLTPLGDPPLFLGFLQGVDFFWTLRLWPQWLLVNVLVIGVFAVWDTLAYRRENRPASTDSEPLALLGWMLNGVLLLGVLAAVVGQKFLPKPVGEVVMIICTLLSLWLTPASVRQLNRFVWGPIIEVAVLFAAIFITMVPALILLKENGGRFGITEEWQYFWLTGLLSSMLDNAPTYLTMGTLAGQGNSFAWLAANKPDLLAAISCGAVFMGANTYIGNGPNFMVKAIAEENAYPMPTFFGYMLYSGVVLLPVFAVVTAVFFWG